MTLHYEPDPEGTEDWDTCPLCGGKWVTCGCDADEADEAWRGREALIEALKADPPPVRIATYPLFGGWFVRGDTLGMARIITSTALDNAGPIGGVSDA